MQKMVHVKSSVKAFRALLKHKVDEEEEALCVPPAADE